MSSVKQNLLGIRSALNKIRPGITIVGMAKFQPLDRITEALENGLTVLGDNYIQEGQELRTKLKQPTRFHYVGRIQSNKVKFLVDYDCVETLSRLEEAQKLNGLLEAQNKTLSVLIQVNIGEESSKAGTAEAELAVLIQGLAKLASLKLEGLMCLPPPLEPVEQRRPFFQKMKQLQKRFGLSQLSMGTSDDFLVAAEEGATHVRLGTCLFGPRP